MAPHLNLGPYPTGVLELGTQGVVHCVDAEALAVLALKVIAELGARWESDDGADPAVNRLPSYLGPLHRYVHSGGYAVVKLSVGWLIHIMHLDLEKLAIFDEEDDFPREGHG